MQEVVSRFDDAMYRVSIAAEGLTNALQRFLSAWRAGGALNAIRPGAPCCGTSNRHCDLSPREVVNTPTGCETCGHPAMCHWY